ncbi:uncharacterized protein N7459_000645 [Penicillium hispanicum]|uniref:uncharacterized protein n=1 Tax=Penicillium hispanicum TaxID=1080232 RepID=UPI002541CEA3|nr:uncharacterized protein N7459_000645 [Penicillium hispanicum]KAJ5594437.1 hypothetical protein N7459_000645 [Penicillium hispanicum]
MPQGLAPPDVDLHIYLHAELLPNIRQITLYISLPQHLTFDGVRAEIRLLESRQAVTASLPEPLSHVTKTIQLPAHVSDPTRRKFNVDAASAVKSGPRNPSGSQCDYSFRLQIDPKDSAPKSGEELIDDYVPWTAEDMSSSTRIRCHACGNLFLKDPCIQHKAGGDDQGRSGWVWKDLPSGNWAEMMDFWHCHKPDPHQHDSKAEATVALQLEDRNAGTKGYGAASHVEATPGTVLIDVATFLLAESDCVGLEKDNTEETKPSSEEPTQRTLHCEKCSATIGVEDPSVGGWRVLKANVSLNTMHREADDDQWQSHSAEVIVAAQLLEMIERESARRFVVHCGQKSGLLLWVFNPDICYSNSSSGHRVNAQQAMKVFFQETDDVDAIINRDLGKPSLLSVEELELPGMIFQALSDALLASNQMLPLSARRFNEWQVGLLSRFSRRETAGSLATPCIDV